MLYDCEKITRILFETYCSTSYAQSLVGAVDSRSWSPLPIIISLTYQPLFGFTGGKRSSPVHSLTIEKRVRRDP